MCIISGPNFYEALLTPVILYKNLSHKALHLFFLKQMLLDFLLPWGILE